MYVTIRTDLCVSQLKIPKSMLILSQENENQINSNVLRRRQNENGNEISCYSFSTPGIFLLVVLK